MMEIDIQQVMEYLETIPNLYAEWYPGCVEPGYNDQPVIAANWNNQPKLEEFTEWIDRVEKSGVSLEWCDEWTGCHDCARAVRTSPDSYGWTPAYVILGECDLLCHECIKTDLDEYERHLTNNPKICDMLGIDWESRGFVRLNDHSFEAGLHPGQNDKPDVLLAEYRKTWDRVLFANGSSGQFDFSWDAFGRNNTEEDLDYDSYN